MGDHPGCCGQGGAIYTHAHTLPCSALLLMLDGSCLRTLLAINPGGSAVLPTPPSAMPRAKLAVQGSGIKIPQVAVAVVAGAARQHDKPGGRC